MELLWLVPVLPLLGALILAIVGGLLPRRLAAAVGCGSVGLAFLVSSWVAFAYFSTPPSNGAFRQTLYEWIDTGPLHVNMGFWLDQLSLVMMLVVTFVGFLIHLYSAEYMAHDENYSLYFCYMNLFVASMLILVLGDNFLSLYLGWEGVGLCSYLLIGFWYRERANGIAAQKAFIITRIGDTALAIALYIIFLNFGTLDIPQSLAGFAAGGAGLRSLALITALLIIGGAIGKSAQLPLQTWLPDAMAGPTPVSALIHAATMVTAGVYLIARTYPIFLLAPESMLVVAIIGVATACYAGFSALAQIDIKRVLAYSTISQIGYMFLALGVGAWWAAIFHFMTHAFFKALLFLSAGIVTHALDEERNIFKMGGIFRRLPIAGWTFLIGSASLAALPLVTAGFYSKDAILIASWTSPYSSFVIWGFAILATLLTGLYIFRAFFLVFLGEPQREVSHRSGPLMNIPVIILSVFAIIAGFVGMPHVLGGFSPFSHFMAGLFGPEPAARIPESAFPLLAAPVVALIGIWLAYRFYVRLRGRAPALARTPAFNPLRIFLLFGWGFDWLYNRLFVRPFVALTTLNRNDFIDYFYSALAYLTLTFNRALSATQSGRVRNYATGLLLGAVFIAIILLVGR